MTGRQFCVVDVVSHPIFRGTAALQTLLDAGVHAVASTPIPGTSGAALGIISVHYRQPGAPDITTMAHLARIARRTGAWLELQTSP